MGFVRWKRQLEDKTVAWMGTFVDTKGVVVVEERNGDVIFGDIQETRVMLPCLQEGLVGVCANGKKAAIFSQSVHLEAKRQNRRQYLLEQSTLCHPSL